MQIADYLLLGLFTVFTLVDIWAAFLHTGFQQRSYFHRIWLLLLFVTSAHFLSFSYSIWILAIISFIALREYFSLIDVRLQDRLAILGGYLCIPFMTYYIQTGWYNMFIITVPVYGFLAIPILVALGGHERKGTVFSIGSIVFGIFLYVYCLGHIGYLARYSSWMAIMLIFGVAVSDFISCFLAGRIEGKSYYLLMYVISSLIILPLSIIFGMVSGIKNIHSSAIAFLIPLLVIMGHRTMDYVKEDLGVENTLLVPGRGQILDNMKSFFYAAPIVFHYYRYFCT